MAQSEDVRRARLRDDERTLVRMKTEVAVMTAKRDQDAAALAALTKSLQRDQAEIDEIQARIQSLAQSVEQRQATLGSQCLSTYPLELLSYVFEWTCYSDRHGMADSHYTPGDQVEVDKAHSLLPLRCAAVCQRWRTAAIHTATLWTYVGVPDHGKQQLASALQYYVRLLLRRSRACLLDVVVELPSDWHAGSVFDAVIRDLAANSGRWRSLRLCSSVSTKELCEDVLEILRVVTPNLRHVLLQCIEPEDMMVWQDDWPSPPPRCLPHAPKLLTVVFEHAPLTFSPHNSTLGTIETFVAHVDDFRWDYFVDAARAMSALRVLHIAWSIVPADILQRLPSQIKLPTLEVLHLSYDPPLGAFNPSFAIPFNLFQAPKIQFLRLTNEMLSELQPLITQCAGCLTRIDLFLSDLDDQVIPALSRATNLEYLDLNDGCTIYDTFFRSLVASSDTKKWPRLRQVDVSNARTEPGNAFAILDFLQARYAGDIDVVDGTSSCAIIEFKGVSGTFRPWVESQMQHILQAARSSRTQ